MNMKQNSVERPTIRSMMRRGILAACALTMSFGILVPGAQAGGKPEKEFLEDKFHMILPGLRKPTLSSRVVGNQLYAEHTRDVRVAPNLLRYVQSFPLPIYNLRASFDVVTEYYYEDFEHAKASLESEAIQVGDRAWVERLTGGIGAGIRPWRPNSKGLVIVKDHVLVDGPEQGYLWYSFMKRKEGVSKEEAETYMRDVYGPALAKLGGIGRYVLGTTFQPAGAKAAGGWWALPQNYDAVDMIWFATLEDMQHVLGSIDFQENIQRAAENAVIDQSQTVSFATETFERVPFPPRYEGPTWEEMKPASAVSK